MMKRWGIRNYWNGAIVARYWTRRAASRAKYRTAEQAWRYDVVRLSSTPETTP